MSSDLSSNDIYEGEDDLNRVLFEERKVALKQIEEDTANLHETFIMTSQLVKSQGDSIDHIESMIENSAENSTKGREHLEQAEKYTNKRRTFYAMLGGILSAGGLIVAGAIYLSAPRTTVIERKKP
jgi:t-SNARE complex subunit (syntaxin)